MRVSDSMHHINVRRRRADALAVAAFRKIEQFIDYDKHRDVMEALIELFCHTGIQVLTDTERAEAGLPPRGPEGWTAQELAVLEAHRLHVLIGPLQPVVFKPEILEKSNASKSD